MLRCGYFSVPGDAQYLGHDGRLAGEQKAQGKGKAQHPLAHRGLGQDLIDQQRGAFGHAPRAAAGAEATALATEGDQMFAVAGLAAHAEKAVFEAAAFEVILELALDILWQRCAVRGHPVSERGVVRVDELVEESVFRPVAFIANSATGRAGVLASWWFGVRLADGCGGCLSPVHNGLFCRHPVAG